VARQLVERLGLEYPSFLSQRILTLMRAEEVAALAREGADFQLHTHWHRTPDDPHEFLNDVLINRERIEAMTGVRPTHLCYPSGNYRSSYLPLLLGEGVRSATTCDPGLATAASHPLLLPRLVDTELMSSLIFESWVTGVAMYLPRRTRRGGYKSLREPSYRLPFRIA
jgi:peptidoglycan/xylan/chitin deacetylase (PgdA/CDA1 family)